MAILIILVVLFFALGIVFIPGKGGFLIAGFNTANEKDKEKYNLKRLNKCFAVFCFGISSTIGICGYVDTDDFALKVGFPMIKENKC